MSDSVFLVVNVQIDKMAPKVLPFIPQFKVCFLDNETKESKRKPSNGTSKFSGLRAKAILLSSHNKTLHARISIISPHCRIMHRE